MFKLIFDKGNLNNYKDFMRMYGVAPEVFSGTSYLFLRQHSRPIVSSLFGELFCPVKMLVSIRTDRTNELIVPDNGKFYTDCTQTYPNEHPLDDTVILAAKSIVDKYFDCGEDLVKVIPRTVPLPVGACLIDDIFYVYITVVVDHTLKNESFFKLKDCHYESIPDQTPASILEANMLDSLPIVNMNPEEVN